MRNGECPRCGSHDIFASKNKPGIAAESIGWNMLTSKGATWEDSGQTLLCAGCGYWESYVTNKAYISEIVDHDGGINWARVIPANWKPDPTGRHQLRYWDGSEWTSSVSDDGTVSDDATESEAQTP